MGDYFGGVGRDRWQALSRTATRVRTDIAFAFIDVLVVIGAYTMALALRMLDPLVGDVYSFWMGLMAAMPFIVIVHLLANAVAGAYGHVWEYASVSEATRLAIANFAATGVIVFSNWVARDIIGIDLVVPYLTLVTGGLLTFLFSGLVRFRSRLFSFRKHGEGPRILVVGNSVEAAAFARRAGELEGAGTVVGFVDEVPGRPATGRLVADLPVLGSLPELADLVESEEVDQVVVASSDPAVVREVVDASLENDVRLRTLPRIEDVLSDDRAPLDVRDIKVEDLLVREPVHTDLSDISSLIRGKTVLVTGGGGSIGTEIVRQVLDYDSAGVWALDRDETLLHEAQLTWGGGATPVLCDIRDARATLRAIEGIAPDIIFHAAALKHVPVLEEFPEEAVLTNIIGTRNVIEAGSRVGAERFVLISTDKAVDPTSVMGASKRVAELLIKAGNERNDGCTYTAVRFGNVLGSRGSVIPTFVSQIRAGGPVTVTHPDMKRYFMTVDEAVQLVLQAAALSDGSEVFLLDMGEPVAIDDLARRLIRLSGLIPEVDIEILYTGARPGEKLQEVLASGPIDVTSNPKIHEVRLFHPGAAAVAEAVEDMEEAAKAGDRDALIEQLNLLSVGLLRRASTTPSQFAV